MRKKLKSAFNYFVVLIFVILGLVGLILPFVPQLIFFAIALIILSFELPVMEEYIEKHVNKNIKISTIYFKLKNKLERFFR